MTDSAPSCDWRTGESQGPRPAAARPKARVMRGSNDGKWSGVRTERYKQSDGSWSAVLRRTIVGGMHGEQTKFHLRYFEIAPGGNTSHERHEHEHVVIAVRGAGVCKLGRRRIKICAMDITYIPPGMAHQLANPHDEPFGFFCIVDAQRDRPELIEE